MKQRTRRQGYGSAIAGFALAWALTVTGCDDDKSRRASPRVDAVSARAPTPKRATSVAPSATPTPSTAARAPSAATSAEPGPQPKQARKLQDSERARVERAFSKYARLDFAHSYMVELSGFGPCAFVTQTTEASVRAKIAGTAVAADAGQDRAVPSFHLVCKDKPTYDFPPRQLEDESWLFQAVDAVHFVDLDKDGKAEVIVFASYRVGTGPDAAAPVPVVTVYRNAGDGSFQVWAGLSEQATDAVARTIGQVFSLVEGGGPEP